MRAIAFAILCLGLGLGLPAPAAADPVLDAWTGRSARYRASDPPPGIPRVTDVRVQVSGEAPPPSGAPDSPPGARWIRVEASGADSVLFELAFLTESAALLSPIVRDVPVRRYLLRPGGGGWIEYVDRGTGAAVLPRYGFDEALRPRAARSLPAAGELPASIAWMGRRFDRVGSGRDADPWSPPDVLLLRLEDRPLVGTSRSFRDDGTGRTGAPLRAGGRDWTWVDLGPGDYRTMIDAGMNLFRVPAAHVQFVIDEPVQFLTWESLGDRPELPFRSNYRGTTMYMDEPAHRLLSRDTFAAARTPSEAAELLVEVTRGRWNGDTGYGSRFLARMLRRAGWALGVPDLRQDDYPVWEAMAGAAWYETEAGVAGVCLQGRFRPDELAGLVRSELDVDFPADDRSCVLFHVAMLRGAARRFGARWGLSVYGQSERGAADLALPLARERGATWLWLWTSDGDHHVPFARQLELVRALRDSEERSRSDATAGDFTSPSIEAGTAVVIPWGYHADDYALRAVGGARHGSLWRSRELELGDRNAAGATYRDVLAAAFREMATLLRAGEEYDVLCLREGERADGYARVVRIGEDARVARTPAED